MSTEQPHNHNDSVRFAETTSASAWDPSEGGLTPYVRYAFANKKQEWKLRRADMPVPKSIDPVYVSSGIVMLNDSEVERVEATKSYYKPSELQQRCVAEDRVAYLVVVESDGLEDEKFTPQELINHLTSFVEEWLEMEVAGIYHSGGRSIHLHTDRYVGREELDLVKQCAEAYNAEYGDIIDTGNYPTGDENKGASPKPFRLPGARHQETNIPKIRLDREARVIEDDPKLRRLHSIQHNSHLSLLSTRTHYHYSGLYESDSGPTALQTPEFTHQGEHSSDSNETEVYKWLINEQPGDPWDDFADSEHWSPYKYTGWGRKSVTIARVEGPPIGRVEDTFRQYTYVPVHVLEATSGNGSYTRQNNDTLMRLSSFDYERWELESGECFVMVENGSRHTEIVTIDEKLAKDAARIMRFDIETGEMNRKHDGREDVLRFISLFSEYDGPVECSGDGTVPEDHSRLSTGERTDNLETEAAMLKDRIDRGEYTDWNRDDILSVVCHIFKTCDNPWNRAWLWCRRVYGTDFDERITYDAMKDLATRYDDYAHVNVPNREDIEGL